jgi:hypothetical protein
VLSSALQGLTALGGIAAVSAANTAAATSAWIDVRQIEGEILVVSDVGIVTAGTLTPTIEDATDSGGSGAATITPVNGAFTAVTTSNDPKRETRVVQAKHTRGFIRYVGTIATGPALVAVTILGRPKNG